jgi:hypothetical protein
LKEYEEIVKGIQGTIVDIKIELNKKVALREFKNELGKKLTELSLPQIKA